MKSLIYIAICLITFQVMGQDPMLQKPDQALDEQAKTLTKQYDAQLGLTSDQLAPFEIKVEEFLIRKEKIENRLEGREKLEALAVLREQEYIEMQNILTQPQLNVYKRVRPSIQPLDVVDKPKK